MEDSKGNRIIGAFVKTVDYLNKIKETHNIPVIMETKKGEYLNMKPSQFKKVFGEHGIPEAEMDNCLLILRSLGFIVAKKGTFTNIQNINGKSTRVITVRKEVFQTLKELGFHNGEEISS